MAKTRDEFRLSKRRLRENPKFRALTPSEKWFWIDTCMFLDDQNPPGISRWDLDRVANAVPCPVQLLRKLHGLDILKGAPAGQKCESYVHTDRSKQAHTLVASQEGPIWYSSAIVREDYLRALAKKSGKQGGNPRLTKSRKTPLRGGVKGVFSDPPVSPSPPLSLTLSLSSSSSSNPPEDSVAAQRAAAAEPPTAASGKSIQARVMDEVWKPKWAGIHGGEDYSPGRVDFVKLSEILNRLGVKRDAEKAIGRFRKIADTALAKPEEFGWKGHRLTVVEKYLPELISDTARAVSGQANPVRPAIGRPTAHDRQQALIDDVFKETEQA